MLGNVVEQKKRGGRRAKKKAEARKSLDKKQNDTVNNHRITEYFTVRRSSRKTAKEIEAEKLLTLKNLLQSGVNEKFLEVYTCAEKGRGIRALKSYEKNEFVVEYKGEIIDMKKAKLREAEYSEDSKIGSYMYYFKHRNTNYCIDATKETPYKGRLINHSALRPNLKTKVIDIGRNFHLILVAKRDIEESEELLYDYGDRTPCTVAKNPWLINS